MDVTLQRHCARYIYVVPDGIRELMTDISREVLRNQPEDIYTFVADYLDALLITRENARVSAKFVQHMSSEAETIVELLERTGMSRKEADRTASVIQEAFRTWNERKGILKEDDDKVISKIIEEADISEAQLQAAAAVIQHAFKSFKMRKEKEQQLLSGIIDWRVAARSAIKLYRKTGVSPEEAKRAANLIKAAYKGYYTRRALRMLNEEVSGEYEEMQPEEDEESITSGTDREERKSKGVRIDFNSTVPHVDFGDEEMISRELPSISTTEEEVQSTQEDDKKRGKDQKDDEEYVVNLLEEIVDSVVGLENMPETPLIIEDKDSDIMDDFIPAPVDETEETQYNRAVPLPLVSQEELEEELDEARKEMDELKTVGEATESEEPNTLKRGSQMSRKSGASRPSSASPKDGMPKHSIGSRPSSASQGPHQPSLKPSISSRPSSASQPASKGSIAPSSGPPEPPQESPGQMTEPETKQADEPEAQPETQEESSAAEPPESEPNPPSEEPPAVVPTESEAPEGASVDIQEEKPVEDQEEPPVEVQEESPVEVQEPPAEAAIEEPVEVPEEPSAEAPAEEAPPTEE